MAAFRDRGDFEATLDTAAEQLGLVAAVVEKDYWVSQALRAVVATHPQDFVFKGGTSLSKCFGLIERFSEDIDVLVLPGDRGRAARDTLMKAMGDAAAEAIGDEKPTRDGGGGFHRTYHLTYPRKRAVGWLRPTIDLEMGIRGGPNPSESRPLEPLIRTPLREAGVSVDEYEDLTPFELVVLHPGRTAIEKLALVSERAETCENEPAQEFRQALGRHFYDLYMLLGDDHVQDFLEDRAVFREVVDDCERVSREFFHSEYTRPSDGYATSAAFTPGERLRAQMEAALASARDLYFGQSYPAWEMVVDRVYGLAHLL